MKDSDIFRFYAQGSLGSLLRQRAPRGAGEKELSLSGERVVEKSNGKL